MVQRSRLGLVVGAAALLAACTWGPWAPQATPKPLFAAFPSSARALPRVAGDRPATGQGLVVKAFYLTFAGGPDRQMDTNGELARVIEGGQRWLAQATGGQRFRWDEAEGLPDVAHVALALSPKQAPQRDLFDELRRLGHLKANQLPLVFAQVADRPTEVLGEGDDVGAVVYVHPPESPQALRGLLEDWANAWLHELGHAMGMAPAGAPHHLPNPEGGSVGHVQDDPLDLMGPFARGLGRVRLDADRQDYFGHGRDDRPDWARSAWMKPWAPKVQGRHERPWVAQPDGLASSLALPEGLLPHHSGSFDAARLGPGPEGSQSLGLFFGGLYPEQEKRPSTGVA